MPNPSIRMSDEMRDEIEARRAPYQGMCEYVREAIELRFQLEDAGELADGERPIRVDEE